MKKLKIRTIKGALAEIKRQDPNTALTEFRVRQLIINGELPFKRAGNKYLLDLDVLQKILEQ